MIIVRFREKKGAEEPFLSLKPEKRVTKKAFVPEAGKKANNTFPKEPFSPNREKSY